MTHSIVYYQSDIQPTNYHYREIVLLKQKKLGHISTHDDEIGLITLNTEYIISTYNKCLRKPRKYHQWYSKIYHAQSN